MELTVLHSILEKGTMYQFKALYSMHVFNPHELF